MTSTTAPEPRIEQRPAMHLVGTICDYALADGDMLRALPLQWAAFGPLIPTVEADGPPIAFGVVLPAGDPGLFRYMAAVPAAPDATPPSGMSAVDLPPRSYLAFPHDGPVSTLNQTVAKACAGRTPSASGPSFLEYYGPGFDPATGRGDIEVWLPLED